MDERTGHKIKLLNRRNIYEKFCSFKSLEFPANEKAEIKAKSQKASIQGQRRVSLAIARPLYSLL